MRESYDESQAASRLEVPVAAWRGEVASGLVHRPARGRGSGRARWSRPPYASVCAAPRDHADGPVIRDRHTSGGVFYVLTAW
ncbi:hypothetical protein ACFY84_35250 [Streptomyces sp. NPDC012438]|uniref:hypothetical protein n=1 Tax=Streptomyces sp. NPDC012438 TaxID=3364833 RepID=UPI0036EEFCB4